MNVLIYVEQEMPGSAKYGMLTILKIRTVRTDSRKSFFFVKNYKKLFKFLSFEIL